MCPEYWVQVVARGANVKNMSMQSLWAEELMYGMMNVFDYLATSGRGSQSYFKHMMLVSRHLMERNFTVLACCKYNKYIVDRVVAGKSVYTEFDPVAAGLSLQ